MAESLELVILLGLQQFGKAGFAPMCYWRLGWPGEKEDRGPALLIVV